MNYGTPAPLSAFADIAALSVFQGVEPNILRKLLVSAHIGRHEKGAIFLAQDEPVMRFYIVLAGWCGASKSNIEGQESIMEIFRRGDFLLEPELAAAADTCPFNLQALTPIEVLMLPPDNLHSAMEQSKIFADNILSAAVQRCHELRDHIEQLTLQSAEQRVGRFLLQMRIATNPEGKDVDLPFDKFLVASYLDIKPETLSRILQSFREKGFVVERGHLTAPHLHALCDYCDARTMRNCHFAHSSECMHSANNDSIVT
jgi:CRP-like cAMP-binding protein